MKGRVRNTLLILFVISSLIYSAPKNKLVDGSKIYLFEFNGQLRVEFESEKTIETPPIINIRVGFLNLPVEFIQMNNNTWIYSVKLPSNLKDLNSYPYAKLRVIYWDSEENLHTENFLVKSPFYKNLKLEMKADTFFDNGPFLKVKITKPIYYEVSKLSLINSSVTELEFQTIGDEITAPIPKGLREENYILKVELHDTTNLTNTIRLEERMFYFCGVLIPLDDIAPKIVDEVIIDKYKVKKGDTISSIAQKYKVSPTSIMMLNDINDPRKLPAGQTIKIGRLVFEPSKVKILVDLFHSKMYVYYKDHLLKSLPVAVGRADATPPGVYTIMEKRKNPVLYWNGEIIPPGSLVNGLGTRWIGLSDPQYGIHGTTKPWEIGRRISHGCIRLRNEDVEKLFEFTPIGTEVIVVRDLEAVPKILTEELALKKEGSSAKR